MKKIKQWRNKKDLLIFSRLYQSIELSFRRPWHCYRLLTGYKFKVYVAPKAWGDEAVIIQRRNENELKVRKSFGGFHSRSLQASLALSILQIFRGPLAIWELGLKNGSYAKVNCFSSERFWGKFFSVERFFPAGTESANQRPSWPGQRHLTTEPCKL